MRGTGHREDWQPLAQDVFAEVLRDNDACCWREGRGKTRSQAGPAFPQGAALRGLREAGDEEGIWSQQKRVGQGVFIGLRVGATTAGW